MSTQEIFAVLKIEATKDENEIRAAYRNLLVTVNPEDDPEGFKRLRGAYEEALTYARTPEEDQVLEAEWMEEAGPVGEVIRQLSQIYSLLPRRLDLAEWETLLRHPVFQSLDEGETAKWGLFSYLADHYRVTCRIWQLLDETFFIRENEQEFREHLPDGFVDFVLFKINDKAGNSDFSYDLFEGAPDGDYDGFIDAYLGLVNGDEDTPEGKAERRQLLEKLGSFDLFHPWYELEKARELLKEEEKDQAEAAARELLERFPRDEKVQMTGAGILLHCGYTEDAEGIYQAYLKRDEKERTTYGNYTSLYGLAGIEAARENWKKARELATDARDCQVTDGVQNLLGRINEALIAGYLERQDELTEEEAELLGWCFIHTGKSEEGWKFFESHPEYAADTMKWHKMMAVTAMSAGQPEEAVEEGRLWRTFLEKELEKVSEGSASGGQEKANQDAGTEDQDGGQECGTADQAEDDGKDTAEEKEWLETELSRSYNLEGRSLRNLYKEKLAEAEQKKAEKKGADTESDGEIKPADDSQPEESTDAKVTPIAELEADSDLTRIAVQAMEAHDKAIEMDPENVDFRMHKMLLLRDQKDYQGMVDQCEKILELDDQCFWACAYMQEAYEGLRMAQEVVDTFYRAKAIYAGQEEIYLRALKVFKAFDQYEDAMSIINQAEEAGVDSLKLKVEKIGVYDHVVENEEEWQEADDFAKAVIERLEREEADPELLAEAYLKRAYLNDTGDKKNKNKDQKLDLELTEKSLALCDSTAARYYLGRYYVEYGKDADKAYEQLKICEERGMNYEWMYFYIAQCHEKFREWDKAIEYYKKVAEVEPEFRDCYWRIGWLYRTKYSRTLQPEYARMALEYINLQGEKFGEIPDHNRRRAFIYLRTKEFDKALEEIDKGLEKDPDSGMWYNKGQILKAMGRYDEAIACFENSVKAEDRYGEDDESCYDRIFQCFLRTKRYEEGIAYFKQVLERVTDEDEKDKCLYALSNLEADQGHTDEALTWLEKQYGSVDLSRRAADTWEDEAERVEDLMDIWLTFGDFTEEEIRMHCEELEDPGRECITDYDAKPEDRALECQNVGEAFFALGDFEKAREFLEQARELSRTVHDYNYSRSLAEYLMKTYYWLGETELAAKAGDLYRKEVERDFKECDDLGLDMETLLTRETTQSKQILYRLFCWAYYTGQKDKARAYGEMMETRDMCWWCDECDCTEMWEVRAMMALMDGDQEAAMKALEEADRTCWLGGVREARMMMRRLKKGDRQL